MKKDYSVIWQILFGIAFIIAAFVIYNAAAQRNVEILKQMNQNKTSYPVQQQTVENKKPAPTLNIENYKFKYSYILNAQGYVKRVSFKIPIPQDEAYKQKITNLSMSYTPSNIYNDGVNKIAEFTFENLNNEKVNITIEGDAALQTYNLKTAQTLNKNVKPEKDLSKYLAPELYVESNDPTIKNIANKIKGSTKEETILKIYEYTQNALTYKTIPGILGAKKAIQGKQGKCSEYSAVMIALCRAKNIPARIITGQIAREKNTKHNWVEVYFDQYGWVTFDPTVMATLVNVYHNGQLVRQEKKLEPFAASSKYIISGKNQFSPYFISYSVADNRNGRITTDEIIEIKKIK